MNEESFTLQYPKLRELPAVPQAKSPTERYLSPPPKRSPITVKTRVRAEAKEEVAAVVITAEAAEVSVRTSRQEASISPHHLRRTIRSLSLRTIPWGQVFTQRLNSKHNGGNQQVAAIFAILTY